MKYLAQNVTDTFGQIKQPSALDKLNPAGSAPQTGINNLLGNMVSLFFAAAAMAFIIMFVWGAVQMILSGGDKEAIAKSKAKITWAIVGVALLAFSYLIFALLEYITGFKFFVP